MLSLFELCRCIFIFLYVVCDCLSYWQVLSSHRVVCHSIICNACFKKREISSLVGSDLIIICYALYSSFLFC